MTTCSRTLLTPAIAVALALAAATAVRARPDAPQPPGCPAASIVRAGEPLSTAAKAAVEEALADELRGEAMYARVLSEHGAQRPFSNAVGAERRHIAFLRALLEGRGDAVPAVATVEAPHYATVGEACSAAVEYETTNAALYDRLLAAGPLPQDVRQVFEHNRAASRDRHRPAFERCAGLGAARAAGPGAGRRLGRGWGYGGGPGFGASQGLGPGRGLGAGRTGAPGCARSCGCGCSQRQCGAGPGPWWQASRQ